MPPVIPTTFEEYVTHAPKYTDKQAYVCLRKMGIDFQWLEDLTSQINLTLLHKQVVEKFDISKRNGESKPLDDRTIQNLFYSYMNLCIWRAAVDWSYRYLGGYLKSPTTLSGRTESKDALGYTSPTPVEEADKYTWEEAKAIQGVSEDRYNEELYHLENHETIRRLRTFILARPKTRGRPRANRHQLVQILDLTLEGHTQEEIGERLKLNRQAVTWQVKTLHRYAKEFFKLELPA
jgi:hypothetical protein